jgi:hypothetical protein
MELLHALEQNSRELAVLASRLLLGKQSSRLRSIVSVPLHPAMAHMCLPRLDAS